MNGTSRTLCLSWQIVVMVRRTFRTVRVMTRRWSATRRWRSGWWTRRCTAACRPCQHRQSSSTVAWRCTRWSDSSHTRLAVKVTLTSSVSTVNLSFSPSKIMLSGLLMLKMCLYDSSYDQWCIGGYTRVYGVYQPPGFFWQRILTSVIINKQGTFRPFATPVCVYSPPFLAIHHCPRPTLRTKKYCSFINYGLSHYQ